jgi:hypothetical protein
MQHARHVTKLRALDFLPPSSTLPLLLYHRDFFSSPSSISLFSPLFAFLLFHRQLGY